MSLHIIHQFGVLILWMRKELRAQGRKADKTGIQENIECGWEFNIGLVSRKPGSSPGHASNVLDLD